MTMMNKEEQRIAILTWMGWKDIKEGVASFNEEQHAISGGFEELIGIDPKGFIQPAPNYPEDLNAMHEAEKKMQLREYWEYADINLKEIVWKNGAPGRAYQCAAASERCEALCRTLWPERWKE